MYKINAMYIVSSDANFVWYVLRLINKVYLKVNKYKHRNRITNEIILVRFLVYIYHCIVIS